MISAVTPTSFRFSHRRFHTKLRRCVDRTQLRWIAGLIARSLVTLLDSGWVALLALGTLGQAKPNGS